MADGLVQSGAGIRTLNGRRPVAGNIALQAGDLPAGLTVLSPWKAVSAGYAAANGDHLLCDTRGGSFTIPLPPNPAPGALVCLSDAGGAWGTFPLTVARNGALIQGQSDDLACDYSDNYVQLVFQGAALGWSVLSVAGPTNPTSQSGVLNVNGKSGASITLGGSDIGYAQPYTAAITRSIGARLTEWTVSVADFRLVTDPDDTLSFQRAVATGSNVFIPRGNYTVSHDIVVSTQGQRIVGSGRNTTLVTAPAKTGFSQGVFVIAAHFIELHDFAIQTAQPDTSDPSAIVQYQPSVRLAGVTRVILDTMGIYTAWVGIEADGNCGGLYVKDLQLSAFGIGLAIDGCYDTVRLLYVHGYVFNCTANQQALLLGASGPQTWIKSARCDDLKITDSLFIGGRAGSFYASSSGESTVSYSNTALDSCIIGIEISAGTLGFHGGYYSPAGPASAARALIVSGDARLTWRPDWMWCYTQDGAASSVAWITVLAGYLDATCCGDINLRNGGANGTGASQDKPLLTMSGGEVIFNSNAIDRAPSTVLSGSLINVNGGRMTAIGNRIKDSGSGGPRFIGVANDEWHRIVGNAAPGWAYSFPAATYAVYGLN